MGWFYNVGKKVPNILFLWIYQYFRKGPRWIILWPCGTTELSQYKLYDCNYLWHQIVALVYIEQTPTSIVSESTLGCILMLFPQSLLGCFLILLQLVMFLYHFMIMLPFLFVGWPPFFFSFSWFMKPFWIIFLLTVSLLLLTYSRKDGLILFSNLKKIE